MDSPGAGGCFTSTDPASERLCVMSLRRQFFFFFCQGAGDTMLQAESDGQQTQLALW